MSKDDNHSNDFTTLPSVRELLDILHDNGYGHVLNRLTLCIRKEGGLQIAEFSEIDMFLEKEIGLVTAKEKIDYIEHLSPNAPILIKWGMMYMRDIDKVIDAYKATLSCTTSTFTKIVETNPKKLTKALEKNEYLFPTFASYLTTDHISKIFENITAVRIAPILQSPMMAHVLTQIAAQQLGMSNVLYIQALQAMQPLTNPPWVELIKQLQIQPIVLSGLSSVLGKSKSNSEGEDIDKRKKK